MVERTAASAMDRVGVYARRKRLKLTPDNSQLRALTHRPDHYFGPANRYLEPYIAVPFDQLILTLPRKF